MVKSAALGITVAKGSIDNGLWSKKFWMFPVDFLCYTNQRALCSNIDVCILWIFLELYRAVTFG